MALQNVADHDPPQLPVTNISNTDIANTKVFFPYRVQFMYNLHKLFYFKRSLILKTANKSGSFC